MKNQLFYLFVGLFVGTFSGIAFIENWLVLNKQFPKSKYFTVPLDPTSWGSVSDWIYILITIFTAYFLMKTFVEQKNINKSSLLPIFSIDDEAVLDSNRNVYILKIRLVKNSAYYFAPSRIYGSYFMNINDKIPLFMYLPEGSTINLDCNSQLYQPNNINSSLIVTLFTYSFKDVANNTYFQSVTFHTSYNKFSLSVPQLKEK